MIKRAILGAVLVVLVGCGARVKSTIPVPDISPMDMSDTIGGERVYVSIDEVRDARPSPELAIVDGKEVVGDEPITNTVRVGLQRAFQRKGFTVSDSAPLVVSVEVRTWTSTVKGGLPGSVKSDSAIFAQVFDPANKLIYSGLYRGSSQMQHPSIDERDIRTSLASAMTEAISQVTSDSQLRQLLSSY